MRTTEQQLQDAMERIAHMARDIADLRGQRRALVHMNRYLRQRPDLPVDRIDVARRTWSELAHLRDALVRAFDMLHAGLRERGLERECMYRVTALIAATGVVGGPEVVYPPAPLTDKNSSGRNAMIIHDRVIVGYGADTRLTSWSVRVRRDEAAVLPEDMPEDMRADIDAEGAAKDVSGSAILVVRPGCPLFDRLYVEGEAIAVDMNVAPVRITTGGGA